MNPQTKAMMKTSRTQPASLKSQNNQSFSSTDAKYSDEDTDSDKEAEQAVKINIVNIDKVLSEKYKFYPPTAEEMGCIFNGIVIFFAHRFTKLRADDILFDVICDSFKKSAQFENLQVEYGCDVRDMKRKFCTLRYDGMMMARGVSETHKPREARIWAAVELINKLAKTCYTLKINEKYYSKEFSQNILEKRECPGLYRVVPDKEVPDVDSAVKYINDFFNKEDSDCELVFTNPKMFDKLKGYAKENPQFDSRAFAALFAVGLKPIAVFKRRTPQYWRDKILAGGKMEYEKYILTPPQGLGKDLLESSDLIKAMGILRCLPTIDPSDLYDPQTTSNIRCIKPPFNKIKKNRKWKKNRKNRMRNKLKLSRINKKN